MQEHRPAPLVAIACGGTGGHLFPGMAVADALRRQGCDVTLLISPKDVDQQAVKSASDLEVVTLPAVALGRWNWFHFARGFWRSYRAARKHFARRTPRAVLAMGGFTSAPPILAGRAVGAATFLHESNFMPGRANRWLARFVDQAFVGFAESAGRLRNQKIVTTGTPVRSQFRPRDSSACRIALGLKPHRPVLLAMGGSQGASGLNQLILATLPRLRAQVPELQFLHLTGPNDFGPVSDSYRLSECEASVRSFLPEMDLALGAATVAVSRAGASALAELAAMGVPPILIPFPAAADNHQFLNARAFADSGAAFLLEQRPATPEKLASLIVELVQQPALQETMRNALGRWHVSDAAEHIASQMMAVIHEADPQAPPEPSAMCSKPARTLDQGPRPSERTGFASEKQVTCFLLAT